MQGRADDAHFHRYAIAKDYVADARVLDVACGEGNGSYILSSAARHVVALDEDGVSITAAKARYAGEDRLEFVQGDVASLSTQGGSFDVIVCFDMLDRVPDAARFLNEARRMLRPGGLLVTSSSSRLDVDRKRRTQTPSRSRGDEAASLDDILSDHFAYREIHDQQTFLSRPIAATSRASDTGGPGHHADDADGHARLSDVGPGAPGVPYPDYVLFFCSNEAIRHSMAPVSTPIVASDDLWPERRDIAALPSGVGVGDVKWSRRFEDSKEDVATKGWSETNVHQQTLVLGQPGRATSEEGHSPARTIDMNVADRQEQISKASMHEDETSPASPSEAEFHVGRSDPRREGDLVDDLKGLIPLLARFEGGDATDPSLAILTDVLAKASRNHEAMQRQIDDLQSRVARDEDRRNHHVAGRIAEATLDRRLKDVLNEHEQALALRGGAEAEQRKLRVGLQQRIEDLEATNDASLERARISDARARNLEQDLANAHAAHDKARRESKLLIERLRDDGVTRENAYEARIAAWSARVNALQNELKQIYSIHDEYLEKALAPRSGAREGWTGRGEAYKEDREGAAKSRNDFRETLDQSQITSDFLVVKDRIQRDLHTSRRFSPLNPHHLKKHETTPFGVDDDLSESLFFDQAFYRTQLKDGQDVGAGALRHYLDTGWLQGFSPCALFDGNWYLTKHPHALETGMSPLSHYVRHGAADGLQPHPCFDRPFYAARYPEALRHGGDVFQHFVRQGLRAGCFPSAEIEAVAGGELAIAVVGRLLNEDLQVSTGASNVAQWPPKPLKDYWLPQALRDYIGDDFGTGPLDLLSYLFSVIAAYEPDPAAFEGSEDLEVLVRRANAFKRVRTDTRPDVSIVIPVYNNIIYTLTSILSILEHESRLSFEILVGDDGSTDATPRVVPMLGDGVVLVRHDDNKGFLRNCNACAQQANGRFLVFLNNDTIVLPGWLDELIAPLEAGTNIGMTGSKLINGDGSLQEAGGIAWDDGSAWNYGRGADPRLPQFNYSKDVDYCSGASIAVTKVLWDQLDGFDPAFAPAYCEDSDLAFRIRASGSRTRLAASSILVHHEGRSHGSDVGHGIKAYQVINQRAFLERWRSVLAEDNFPNATNVFLARDRSRYKPHILIVDHYVPQWDRDAGSRTMLHFIRMFVDQGFHVIFWPDNLYRDRRYAKPLQDMGVEIIYGPQYINQFEAWMSTHAADIKYVLLSRPQFAEKYIDFIDRASCKILYYGHDLHWKRMEKQWSVEEGETLRENIEVVRQLELTICRKSDVVLYPSAEEIAFVKAELPTLEAALAVPAWCFNDEEIDGMRSSATHRSGRDPMHVMFVGGFQHTPNVDGMGWFASEVWPLVKQRHPRAKLTIAGSNPPAAIRKLVWASLSITVTGAISDEALGQLYAQASVAVIPLRFGGGVKGKVIEAFTKGIAVVSTSIGVQGLVSQDDVALVADDPQGFAALVGACLEDPSFPTPTIEAAINLIEKDYSSSALVDCLKGHVPELANRPGTRIVDRAVTAP